MKKTPSLFKRDYEGTRLVYDEVVPGSEWVMLGEGVATLKLDGTSCLIRDGKLYKRYELKRGKARPPDFEAAQEPDPVTGDIPGWAPVADGAEDRWHREAWENLRTESNGKPLPDGTFELMGPKVQGNTLGLATHQLIAHGSIILEDAARTFETLREYFRTHEIEGIVWHHPDGRMVKIKRRDFGYPWPPTNRKG